MASCLLHPSPPQPPPPPSSTSGSSPRTRLVWRGRRRRHCVQVAAAAGQDTLQKDHLTARPRTVQEPLPAIARYEQLVAHPRTGQESRLADARRLFDEMPERSGRGGSAALQALAHARRHVEVFRLFGRMQRDGAVLDKYVFPSVLAACGGLRNDGALLALHGLVVKCGLCRHVVVGTALVNSYVVLGSLDEARKAFEEIAAPNMVSWNVIIGGYVRSERWAEAWDAFSAMQRSEVCPNYSIIAMAMQTCGALQCIARGKQLHAKAVVRGYKGKTTVWNCLVDMYAKCGDLYSSTKVFDLMVGRDQASWDTIISRYVRAGLWRDALDAFVEMQHSGCVVDRFALGSGLTACARLADLKSGRAFHGCAVRRSLDSSVIPGTAIVDMYGRCGRTDLAELAFLRMDERNLASWDALMSRYVENEQPLPAITTYREMSSVNLKPDQRTFVRLLQLCGDQRYTEYGRQIHAHAMKTVQHMNVVLETELVYMYAKCGRMEVARLVFLGMKERNLISWNVLLSGYVDDGQADVTIGVYREMESGGVEPDEYTFAGLLSLCRYQGLESYGRQIHAHVIRRGFERNVVLQTVLVHMYVTCRRLRDAEAVCRSITERNCHVERALTKVLGEVLQALPWDEASS